MAGPIGTEVEEDDAVVVFDRRNRITIVTNNRNWLDKLIRNAALIRFFDACNRLGCAFADRFCLQNERALGSFPALVTVHRVVTADDGSNFAAAELFYLFL